MILRQVIFGQFDPRTTLNILHSSRLSFFLVGMRKRQVQISNHHSGTAAFFPFIFDYPGRASLEALLENAPSALLGYLGLRLS
jgi:hypothetical protein